MAINALTKLAAEISDLPIKNMDGTAMLDENQQPVTATVFGPASKIWEVANSLRKRKTLKKVREQNNKIEAAADDLDDVIDFLCSVTKQFNGLEIKPEDGAMIADQVRAIYSHPQLGYVRDQMDEATRNWENFIKASQRNSASTPASSPG